MPPIKSQTCSAHLLSSFLQPVYNKQPLFSPYNTQFLEFFPSFLPNDLTFFLTIVESAFIFPDMDYIRQMPGCKCNKRTLFDVFDPIF